MNRMLFFGLCLFHALMNAGETTRLKADERIIFYPAIVQDSPGRTKLQVEIHGYVFEPEKARVSVAALREVLELKAGELTAAEEEVFARRARLFLVDHERGKKVFIRLGTNEHFVGKSGADGIFSGKIRFRRDTLPRATMETGIPYSAVLGPDDRRRFSGRILPLADAGVSVISDIDDTIKVTEVRDHKAILRNTFLREFQPVPGMAQFYQTLARSNHAVFHYVSASPWQLYAPLDELVRSNGFPAGTFHLKPFRWKSRSFSSLFADPVKYKLSVIEPLLKKFPHRKFILVGDSGERDPEIYGELARKYPNQIEQIYIRDVTAETAASARYDAAFRSVPHRRWQVFRQAVEIRSAAD